MKKVLYLSNTPVPYRVRFFNELAQYCDLTVLYERQAASTRNADWVKSEETIELLIDSLIVDPNTNQQDLMDRLKFIARVSYRRDSYPISWFLKCMEYLQYVAYNYKEREDVSIHQEYAAALEILVRKMKNGECGAPFHIVDKPVYGKTDYNMRPDGLKLKPKAKPKTNRE